MMHVAINALSITNRSGTGRYTWGLIHGFVKRNDPDLFLSVFLPSDFVLPKKWRNNSRIRFYSIPIGSTFGRIVWEQLFLPSFLRIIQPDILHSPAFIAPVFRRISPKQIVTIHDLTFRNYPQTIPLYRRKYYEFSIYRSIQYSDLILTDSQTIADELAAIFKPSKAITFVHLGVDRDTFHSMITPNDLSILELYEIEHPYFLTVGTKEPRKNLSTILQATEKARSGGLDMPLVLAGRVGWMQDVRELQRNGIRILDYVPEEHLPALYRNAHTFLAPSMYEGYDLPALESLACGTPVIASDIPIHREILKNNAFFVKVDHVDAWADALLQTSQDKKDSLDFMSREWSEVAKETYQVYRSILQTK